MKLAFSTIACPAWDFDEIFSTAVDFGFNGIEIRGISSEMYAPAIKVFSDDNIQKTKERMSKANLEISCLTSSACLAEYDEKDKSVVEAKAYIDLAQKLGCKYVRVMPTGVPHKDGGDIKLCKKQYLDICNYGQAKGVTPIMETNGMFADTKVLKEFMQAIDSLNKGVLWDINHPYRFNGENIDETIANIGSYVKHIHIKDSIVENGGTVYKLLGYGDIPIKKAIKALNEIGYNGYLSLEWVKRWNQNLEEPYIVIPNYAGYMRALLR